MMCDGADRDEVLFSIDSVIDRFGWSLQVVEGHDPPALDWVYSIGLVEGFGHPELVVTGVEIAAGALVLNELGSLVRDGLRLEPGTRVLLRDRDVEIGLVHPAHFDRGLMAIWQEYYGKIGPPMPTLEALQVVFSDASFCHQHEQSTPRLSDPNVRLEVQTPPLANRAERRRQARRRH